MRQNTCAIISCDPMGFPWGYNEEDEGCAALKLLLLNRITVLRSEGVTDFAVVLDSGVGLYAAEMINSLRENLTCIIPYEDQATKWTPELRDRYFNEQAKCSNVLFAAYEREPTSEIKAILDAIDMAETVIAVTGQDGTAVSVALHYAERLNKQVVAIDSGRMQYHV